MNFARPSLPPLPAPCTVVLELAPAVFARLGRDPAAELGRLIDRIVGSCLSSEPLAKRVERLERDDRTVTQARAELVRAAAHLDGRGRAIRIGRARLGLSQDVETYISELETFVACVAANCKAAEQLENDRALFRLLSTGPTP